MVIFAVFPYVVYVLRDLLDVQMPVNLVFMLMFCFVLLVLLSLSIGVSQLADKCKRLTQKMLHPGKARAGFGEKTQRGK